MAEKGPGGNQEQMQQMVQSMYKEIAGLVQQVQKEQQAGNKESVAALIKKIKALLEKMRQISPEAAAQIENQIGQYLEL